LVASQSRIFFTLVEIPVKVFMKTPSTIIPSQSRRPQKTLHGCWFEFGGVDGVPGGLPAN
jgi:hypothetical protein